MNDEQLAVVSMKEAHAGHALVVYQTENMQYNVFDGVVDYDNPKSGDVEAQDVYCRTCGEDLPAIVVFDSEGKGRITFDDEEAS